MLDFRYQVIRIGVPAPGASVRINGEFYETHSRLKAIALGIPNNEFINGSTLSFKVGNEEVFDDDFEVGMITYNASGDNNRKFKFFEGIVDAKGNPYEIRYKDSGNNDTGFPYEVSITFLLTGLIK